MQDGPYGEPLVEVFMHDVQWYRLSDPSIIYRQAASNLGEACALAWGIACGITTQAGLPQPDHVGKRDPIQVTLPDETWTISVVTSSRATTETQLFLAGSMM